MSAGLRPIGGRALAFLRRVSLEGQGSLYAETTDESRLGARCAAAGYLARDQRDNALYHITPRGLSYLSLLARCA